MTTTIWLKFNQFLPFRNLSIALAILLSVYILPIGIYAVLVWLQFNFIKISGYIPIEELLLAMNPLNLFELFSTPILSINMTSGLILSNMYNLTFGQLLLTLALGITISANLFTYIDLRQRKCANNPTAAAFAAGGGLLATISASSTGIMGCCGSSLTGGLLALAGFGASASSTVYGNSTLIQLLFIILFAFNWLRLKQVTKI